VVIVARQFAFPLADSRGAEEHHRIAHFCAPEVRQRFQELREDAQRPRVRTVQELVIEVGNRPAIAMGCCWVSHSALTHRPFSSIPIPCEAVPAVSERRGWRAATHWRQTPAIRKSARLWPGPRRCP